MKYFILMTIIALNITANATAQNNDPKPLICTSDQNQWGFSSKCDCIDEENTFYDQTVGKCVIKDFAKITFSGLIGDGVAILPKGNNFLIQLDNDVVYEATPHIIDDSRGADGPLTIGLGNNMSLEITNLMEGRQVVVFKGKSGKDVEMNLFINFESTK